MNESLHLGVIRGIRVGINWSLLPVFMLIVSSLAKTSLPSAAPGYSMWGYWVFAACTAAAFYASLLAHELAHALVAGRRGVDVSGIVLWLFGGVAQLEGDTPDPRAELEVAAAGPATSLGLAAAGVAAAWLLAHVGASSLLVSSVQWLALVNALLALFNLLPAFPLDGGRILRALLWRHWRDPVTATEVAAKLGRVIGYAMIALGIVEFLAGDGAFGALWLTLIGWFITVAADQQRERVSQQSRVAGLRVADAMSRHPLVVPAKATVGEVIEHYVRPSWFASFPVADADGRIVGLATVQRMAKLPREKLAGDPDRRRRDRPRRDRRLLPRRPSSRCYGADARLSRPSSDRPRRATHRGHRYPFRCQARDQPRGAVWPAVGRSTSRTCATRAR